jgi:hypothetical protein
LSGGIADVDRVVELVIAGLLIVLLSVHILRFQVRAHILQYVTKDKDPPFTTTRLKRWRREERKLSGWVGRRLVGVGRRGVAMSHQFLAQNTVGGLRRCDHGKKKSDIWVGMRRARVSTVMVAASSLRLQVPGQYQKRLGTDSAGLKP